MLRLGAVRLRLGAYAAAALASTVSAGAQTTSQPVLAVPIAVGDTVQVEAPPGVPSLIRARIVELRPSAFVVRINSASDTVVPFGEVKWLAVRRGTHGHPVAGALVGLVAGAVAGGAIFTGRTKQPLGATISKYAIVGGASGGVAGVIAGDLIRSDRWVPVIKGPSPVEDYGLLENESASPIPLAQGRCWIAVGLTAAGCGPDGIVVLPLHPSGPVATGPYQGRIIVSLLLTSHIRGPYRLVTLGWS